MSNRWSSKRLLRPAALGAALLALVTTGCTTGALPLSFPPSSAASPLASAATVSPVGIALREDPPLPGESVASWPGLSGERAPGAIAPDGREGAADARALLGRPLTAEASVRAALLDNRELRASLRELGVARGALLQAGLLPNPAIEVELSREQARGEAPRPGFALEYDLTRALLTPLRADAARADLEAARHRAAAMVVTTGYEVRAAFFAVQAAMERLAVAVRVLDAFAASREAARALFEAGNVPELDFTTQDAAYQEAKLTVARLEIGVLDRREALNRWLGLHGEQTSWTVEGTLPPAPKTLDLPADLEQRAIRSSLELAEMRSRIEAAARRVGLVRTEGWLPDVSLSANAEQEGPAWRLGGAVRVTLPVFDRRQGEALSREAEVGALTERFHGAAIAIRSAAREASNRLAWAHAQALHLQEVVVPARSRVLEQARLQYNAMQIGVFQLLQARRDQLAAELARIEALRELWTAQTAVDALLAGRRVALAAEASSPSPALSPNESTGGH